jgi:hypothetical protein
VLQGTFDIFSLTELIAMLAGGNKTGTLDVQAGATGGLVHFREGLCCGVEPVREPPQSDDALAAALVQVCFELVREPEGEFRFLTDEPPGSDHLVVVDEPMGEVRRLLEEWREVQGLIPSLDLRPSLASALAGDSITLTAAEWSFVVGLDGRASVQDLVDRRGESLLEVCQEIAALVDRGALRLDDARLAIEHPAVESPAPKRSRRGESTSASTVPVEPPSVMPVEPYGPGVDDAASASASASAPAATAVSDDDVPIGANGEPLDGEDVKDRGALLRMFSALRDA